MKKFLAVLGEVLLVLVVFVLALLVFLTQNEYNPSDEEPVTVEGMAVKSVPLGQDLSILSWNIGYSALGNTSDFIMDGGGTVPPATPKQVKNFLMGIQSSIKAEKTDFIMIQEIDLHSTRSYYIDMSQILSNNNSTFGYNYKCKFVPFPIPPLATVNSGIFTTTNYKIESAIRKSVPCPFSWPVSTANLKRGLLVSYLPIENSTKKLVLINLHLEAYSDNEARIVQLDILNDFMADEYAKGNYVIAGGDFNQIFPGTTKKYPNTHKDNWDPNELPYENLRKSFKLAYDDTTPTCRLLNQPYDPSDSVNTQYYVIDGFIITPNVTAKSVKTLDKHFENSDHNPVKMVFQLNPSEN